MDPSSPAPAAAPAVLWRPGEARVRAARLTAFTDWLAAERGLRFAGYEDLWRWSVESPEVFWESVWRHFDVRASRPYARVLGEPRMPGARWFEGAELSFASHVFRHRGLATPAIVFESEALGAGELSWAELERQVAALAATLRAAGVGRGDRVAAFLPNVPQTVVAFLAVASLGAIWSVCSPDMGPALVDSRFRQIAPKVFVTCDGYRFGGKAFDRREAVAGMLAALPSVEVVLWVPLLGLPSPPQGDRGRGEGTAQPGRRRVIPWSDAIAATAPLEIADVPFDHPLWILYSSGTTGLPKPIVHGHGGALLNGLVNLALHTDTRPGTRFLWSASTGWIVWNGHVMGLLTGSTVCLYDGAVTGPGPGADWSFLWRYAARNRLNVLGAGAAFYANCLKHGVRPADLDLGALDTILSTGSPLSPECYRWIYDGVKRDVWLNSLSGGTDIAAAFLSGAPTLPVREGEMQCRVLGAAVEAWDEAGRPVLDEVGELVCTRPLPSMPLRFWNDPEDRRYRESYFETFRGPAGEGIWRHGDWLRLVPRPEAVGAIIYGRSDSTINRQGVRMGTAEIYAAVETLPEVLDSLVVDLEYLGRPSCLALFVVLRSGLRLDAALERRLREGIRAALSPRHVPDEIVQIPEVPRTLTGKKLEVPVRKLLLGQPPEKVVTREAMANPASIDWFVAYARSPRKP
jgi:acetoacetyl-CoA synthetase